MQAQASTLCKPPVVGIRMTLLSMVHAPNLKLLSYCGNLGVFTATQLGSLRGRPKKDDAKKWMEKGIELGGGEWQMASSRSSAKPKSNSNHEKNVSASNGFNLLQDRERHANPVMVGCTEEGQCGLRQEIKGRRDSQIPG
ncbi:hypothetical protein HAX54_011870 [Datura stramonium]|uniref:Uncharacterized protein n=1 Tax=Datura stramonium TaxID=4076 RepID=A0ABS8TLM4_DATST|nr:hypothetical protein [Datura stramonium]